MQKPMPPHPDDFGLTEEDVERLDCRESDLTRKFENAKDWLTLVGAGITAVCADA